MSGKIVSSVFALIVASIVLLAPCERADAATATYTYDAAGRLTRVEYGNGRGFIYQYDNAGNLIARTALVPAGPTRRRAVRSASAQKPPSQTARPAEKSSVQ